MSVFIKLCGLSTVEAVQAASRLGADYAGFVIYPPSPRHVSPEKAGALRAHLGAAKAVAVLVNPDDALLEEVMRHMRPDMLQLHGNESPARVAEIRARSGLPVIKSIPVRDPADLDAARSFTEADMLLFDAKSETLPGGTGVSFDWNLLNGSSFPLPWLLSGGLNGGNVAAALRVTGAQGVDVSSGIESAPGVKDIGKMEAFVNAVKNQ